MRRLHGLLSRRLDGAATGNFGARGPTWVTWRPGRQCNRSTHYVSRSTSNENAGISCHTGDVCTKLLFVGG